MRRMDDPMYAKAYQSYSEQRQRCLNPRNKRFKNYGARGIEVRYERQEFIEWWFRELTKRPTWRDPTVGRLDHGGHYEFGNVRLEERSENSKEMRARIGSIRPLRPILIFDQNADLVYRAPSVKDAAAWVGASPGNITAVASGAYGCKTIRGYVVRYEEDACVSSR